LAKIENVKNDRDLKGLSNSGVDEIIILIEEML
jgi:hypothetical protein